MVVVGNLRICYLSLDLELQQVKLEFGKFHRKQQLAGSL